MIPVEERMKRIIEQLNLNTELYNKHDLAIMSDKRWDELYFELKTLEEQTGIIYSNSPTQIIQYDFVTTLEKIEHKHPMLSLDKSKNLDDIKAFIGDQD